MRKLLIILFYCSSATGQDYVANWVTTKENGVINFQIQQSSNNINWKTISTLTPKKKDSNFYKYTLPVASNYYRIKALYSNTIIYTTPIKVTNKNVVITNAKYVSGSGQKADNISFTANNEGAIDYYSIERNISNGVAWSIVGKLMQTNKKNYVVNITKSGSNRKYRLKSVYKNGIVSPYINFIQ